MKHATLMVGCLLSMSLGCGGNNTANNNTANNNTTANNTTANNTTANNTTANNTTANNTTPAVTTVGENGGTVATMDGAGVTVPAGALTADTEITVVAVAEAVAAVPADAELAGTAYAFTPHGTTFEMPVTIELPHDGTATRVLRLDDESDTTWEEVTDVTATATSISFETSSFSIYTPARTAPGAACGPPVAGTAGTTDVTGASFPVLDVVARLVDTPDGASDGGPVNPFRTTLLLRFTDYADACAVEDQAIFRKDARIVELKIVRNSDTAFPGPPDVGTYVVDPDPPLANDGTSYFIGGLTLTDANGICSWNAGSLMADTPTGSVTITSVTATTIEGSVDYTDPKGLTYSGTFSAPICGSTDPEAVYCCWTP